MIKKPFSQTMSSKLPLKLNIQHFAEPGGQADPNQQTDPNTQTDPSTQTDPAATGSNTQTDPKDPKQEPVTFTQEQLNKIAASEAKKAREKVLKDLGIEDVSKGKEALKAYKAQREAEMTEADKAKALAETLSKEKDSAMTKLQETQAELAALKQDADPEKVEDLVALANKYVDDETDISAAIGKVLEKYPHFKREAVEVPKPDPAKPHFSTGQHQGGQKPSEQDMWNQAFTFSNTTN